MNKLIKTDNLTKVGIVTVLVCTVTITLLVVTFHGNITGFFRIGDVLPLSPFIDDKSAHVFEGEVGYDGQMFLSIALNPSLKHEGTIAALDNPKYRYRRIGYPIVGYLLGLGSPNLIPYTMVLVNVLCIIALPLIVSELRDQNYQYRNEMSSSYLLILAIPGIWVSLSLSTSDLLGTTLFATSLLLLKSHRIVPASLALCGACLTREIYIATAIVLAMYMLVRRRKKASASLFLCTVPVFCWYVYLNMRIQVGTLGVQENLSVAPFTGIIDKIRSVTEASLDITSMFEVYCFMILVTITGLVILSMACSWKNLNISQVAAFPFIAILAFSKIQILEYHVNYFRIFLDAWVILFLISDGRWFDYSVRVLFLLSSIASAAYIANYIIS